MGAINNINLTGPQREFFNHIDNFTNQYLAAYETGSPAALEAIKSLPHNYLFCGGLGSGKTFAGALAFYYITERFKMPGLITAPSFTLMRDSTLSAAAACYQEWGLPFKISISGQFMELGHYAEKEKYKKMRNGVFYGPPLYRNKPIRHFLRTYRNIDAARGCEVGYHWGDEFSRANMEANGVIQGRLRGKINGMFVPALNIATTTPNRKNFIHELWIRKNSPDYVTVKAHTMSNIHNLGPLYYESLQALYSTEMANQELAGEFVDFSGAVFTPVMTKILFNPKYPVSLSFDFGFNWPAVLFFQTVENPEFLFYKGKMPGIKKEIPQFLIICFDAVLISKKKISEVCEAVQEKLNKYGIKKIEFITGDPSGNNESAVNYTTEMNEVKKFFGLGPRDARYSYNPKLRSISSGINRVNTLFQQGRLAISENLQYKRKDDYVGVMDALRGAEYKKDGDRDVYAKGAEANQYDHPCDALRYYVMFSDKKEAMGK